MPRSRTCPGPNIRNTRGEKSMARTYSACRAVAKEQLVSETERPFNGISFWYFVSEKWWYRLSAFTTYTPHSQHITAVAKTESTAESKRPRM